MKNARLNTSNVKRILKLETLESREMLSVNPLEGAAFSPEAAVYSAATLDSEIIDLSSLSAAVADTTVIFTRTNVLNQFQLDWEPIDGASSYNVKISRNGGDSWITYAKPTADECVVNALYVGKSYSFRIYGVNAKGKLFGEPIEATIVPTLEQYDAGIKFQTTNGSNHKMSWNSLPNATDVNYVVQVSDDNGETWIKYRQTQATSISFHQTTGTTRLYRVYANGQHSNVAEFSALVLQADSESYVAKQTINLTVKSEPGVAYSIKWNYVMPDGDVEIPEAANLTSYAPKDATWPIKIVVEQDGKDYKNTLVVDVARTLEFAADAETGYDALLRSVNLTWKMNPDAVEYRIYKMVEGKWVTNAKFVLREGKLYPVYSNQQVHLYDKATYEIKMIEPNQSYGFKLVAVGENGKIIASEAFSYKPIGLYIDADSYNPDYGAQLQSRVVTSYNDVRYQWQYPLFYSGEWRNVATNGTNSYLNLTAHSYDVYRLVVSAYDDDGNLAAVSHAYIYPRDTTYKIQSGFITFPEAAPEEVADDTFSITFKQVPSVDVYDIQFMTDSYRQNWSVLRSATYQNNHNGTVTFTNNYGTTYDYRNAQYRVRAHDDDGFVSEWYYFNI